MFELNCNKTRAMSAENNKVSSLQPKCDSIIALVNISFKRNTNVYLYIHIYMYIINETKKCLKCKKFYK
jgi:hypothetical protein